MVKKQIILSALLLTPLGVATAIDYNFELANRTAQLTDRAGLTKEGTGLEVKVRYSVGERKEKMPEYSTIKPGQILKSNLDRSRDIFVDFIIDIPHRIDDRTVERTVKGVSQPYKKFQNKVFAPRRLTYTYDVYRTQKPKAKNVFLKITGSKDDYRLETRSGLFNIAKRKSNITNKQVVIKSRILKALVDTKYYEGVGTSTYGKGMRPRHPSWIWKTEPRLNPVDFNHLESIGRMVWKEIDAEGVSKLP